MQLKYFYVCSEHFLYIINIYGYFKHFRGYEKYLCRARIFYSIFEITCYLDFSTVIVAFVTSVLKTLLIQIYYTRCDIINKQMLYTQITQTVSVLVLVTKNETCEL